MLLRIRQSELRRAERRERIKAMFWIIAMALIGAGTVYLCLHIELITLAKGN